MKSIDLRPRALGGLFAALVTAFIQLGPVLLTAAGLATPSVAGAQNYPLDEDCAARRWRLESLAVAASEAGDGLAVDEGGWAAAHHAAAQDDAEALARLAAEGVFLSLLDVHGQTPLHVAAAHRAAGAASELVERGVAVDKRDCYGRTALDLAAEAGSAAIARTLLANGALPGRDPEEREAVIARAVTAGHDDTVRTLLESGLGPPEVGPEERFLTALHDAARFGRETAAELLIEHGWPIDVAEPGYSRRRALELAVAAGHAHVVRALLKAGAAVNALDYADTSPLHLAVRQGRMDVVRALLKAGAAVNALDHGDTSPLHLAVRQDRIDIVRVLLKAGAAVNALDRNGISPLHLATRWGRMDVARLLVEAGADLEALGFWQGYMRTPHEVAQAAGHQELAAYFTGLGHRLDIFAATRIGDADRVRDLLDQDPLLVSAHDADGWTPLRFALEIERPAIARLLIARGANVSDIPEVSIDSYSYSGGDPVITIPEPRLLAADVLSIPRTFDQQSTLTERVSRPRQAELLHDVAARQMGSGHFLAAVRSFRAVERTLLASTRDPQALVPTRLNLARALVHGGLYDDGDQIVRGEIESLERASQVPSSEGAEALSAALETLGLIALRTGHHGDARTLLIRALEIRRQQRDTYIPAGFTQMLLAELDVREGSYLQAEETYERACELAGWVGGHHYLFCKLALAAVRHRLGDLETAVAEYRSVRDFLERRPDLEPHHLGLVYNNLADLHLARGELVAARQVGRLGLDFVAEKLGQGHRLIGDLALTLAQVELAQGDLERARANIDWALDIIIATRGQEHPAYALALVERGRTHLAAGSHDMATTDLVGALALADQSGAVEARWQARDALAVLLQRKDQRAGAIFFAKEAVGLIQDLRRDLTTLTPDLQKGFLRNKLDAYRRLADLLVDEGRIVEAQAVLAMLKVEELAAFTRANGDGDVEAPVALGIERQWQQRYAEINADAIARGRQLQALKDLKRSRRLDAGETARLNQLRADAKVLNQAYGAFVEEVSSYLGGVTSARAADIGGRQLDKLRALQRTLGDLGDGVVALHYLITRSRLRIIVTTPDAQVVRSKDIDDVELYRQIATHRTVVQNPSLDPRPAARALYDTLLGPIADDLSQAQATTLLLSLDGAARYVPFAALWNGKQWLAESYRFSLLAEAARDKLKDHPTNDWRVAGLGVSRAAQGFAPLPGVRDELDGIVRTDDEDPRGVLPGEVHLDRDFGTYQLRDVLEAGYPVVHLATHFALNPGTRRDSFLLLGDGDRLSLEQIEEEDLTFDDVELLTLSACNTAVGTPGADGREVEGLAAVFQNLGTPSVLATLWPVADESTSLFMQALYRHLRDGDVLKAEALQTTQLEFVTGKVLHSKAQPDEDPAAAADWLPDEDSVIEANRGAKSVSYPTAPRWVPTIEGTLAHPYYWAPFLLMGNFL